ncbi:MAG: hypothetical protein HEEMFOPI_01161 [Holosporales bacterium]
MEKKLNFFPHLFNQKGLMCVLFLMLRTDNLLATSECLMKMAFQGRPLVSCGMSRLYNGLTTVKRCYSFRDENDQVASPDIYKGDPNPFARCELLFNQCQRLFQELNDWNPQKDFHLARSFSNAPALSLQNCEKSVLKNVENNSLTPPKTEPKKVVVKNMPPLHELKKFDYHTSKIMKMKHDALVHKALSMAKPNKEINVKELKSIIDLYTALVRRPKDGITKVLTGVTDTHKSNIYNAVVAYAKSKESDLDAFRKIFTKLSNEFKENIAHIIYRAAEDILRESKHINDNISEIKNLQDALDLISKGSHPLYPIDPEEVRAIFDLYSALSHRPRDGVTKVLNYLINTSKSSIYNEIVRHVEQRGANLETYRYMYARAEKALNENGIKVLYRILNEEKTTIQSSVQKEGAPEIQESLSVLQDEDPQECLSVPPSQEEVSDFKDADNDSADLEERTSEMPIVSAEKETIDQLEEPKYKMSIEERDRLNRLYGLLPEHSGRSITGVLSGSTLDNNLPIWNAIQEAIEQIKRESIKDSDALKINLEYFKKLFMMNLHSPKVLEKKSDLSGDVLRTVDGKYSITKQEQERLNRIYNLLSDFPSRSITGVLSGSTIDNGLPVWKAVQKAIEKIKQEAIRKGDKTPIDFNYFRRLHWSSVRVIGKGGSRDFLQEKKVKPAASTVKGKIKLKVKSKNNKSPNKKKK